MGERKEFHQNTADKQEGIIVDSLTPPSFLRRLRSSVDFLREYWMDAPWEIKTDIIARFVIASGVVIATIGGITWAAGEYGNITPLKDIASPILKTGLGSVIGGFLIHAGLEATVFSSS